MELTFTGQTNRTMVLLRSGLRAGLLTAFLLVLTQGLASAETGQNVEDPLAVEETAPLEKDAADSIEGTLEQRDELLYDPRRRSLFPDFYYSLRKKQLDLWQKLRIELTLTYDVLTQHYNDPGVSVAGTAGDLTLAGRWLVAGHRFNKPIYLAFRIRDRRAYSEFAPADIQSQTDLLWGTVDGFNNSGFQVPDFHFDQRLFEDKLSLRYGQFSIDSFVDKHSMRGAKRYFLNKAFSSNPTVNFPSYGAGFATNWKPNDRWELTVGFSNIQGVEGDAQVDFSLDSNALFGSIQAAYGFTGLNGKGARLQLMSWAGDENNVDDYQAGRGYSATFEHQGREENEIWVFRAAQSSGDPTNTDMLLFIGHGKQIRGFDSLGIGVGAGRSSETQNWQTVVESYYRWQITKELVITPDLQIIFGSDPTSGESKVRVVGGLRLGIVF
jgi:porin